MFGICKPTMAESTSAVAAPWKTQGPVNVGASDPATGGFQEEYTVSEEAIELYRVFGGDLYLPAADPTRGDTNKFYRQFVGAPDLAHVRDLYWHNNKLIGVGNARGVKSKTSAIVSLDQGTTFQAATDPATLGKYDN